MLRQLIAKLLGNHTPKITIAEVGVHLEDPCSRHLDHLPGHAYQVAGRDCSAGDFVRHAAATPETAAMNYCRN